MSVGAGVHALVRRAHEERVPAILRECGTLSRAQIAARAGLSRTTLSEIAGDLLGRGAIVVTTTDAGQRAGSGRPAERLALDPRSGQFLGVDLGHTRVRVVVADVAHGMTSMYQVGAVEHDPTRSGLDDQSYLSYRP